MRRALVVLAIVGCGRTSPAPHTPFRLDIENLPPLQRPLALRPLPADLPVLDIDPDPADWRWPLPGPPQLMPSGDIAAMFGSRADWTTLCAARRDARGVDRDEALAYLRAWCDLPPDITLAKALAPLVIARTSSIATAASIDVAAILALQLRANEAMQWLGYQRAREPLVLDALAASYLSADRMDDVRAVTKVLGASRAWGNLQCRRLFRELFVADRSRRDAIRIELSASRDAVCARLSAHASCTLSWGPQAPGQGAEPARIDLERCTAILLDQPELGPRAYLTIAAAHWPSDSRSFETWLAFVQFAIGALEAPGGGELVHAAIENAAATSDCDAQLVALQEAIGPSSTVARWRNLTGDQCRRLRR